MSTATSAPQHDRAQLDALRQDRGALVRALTDAGAEHVGDSGTLRCPFHEDEHASGSIREKGGAWRFKCFACAASGDVFDVTMKARGVAFPQAADLLTGAEQPGDGKRKTRARAGTPKPNGRVYPTFDEAVEATRRGIERVGGCRVEVAQHWVYLDASGERESFRIIRFDTPKGKTFRPTFHDAHGWQVRRPDGLAWPYRWPEIGEGDVYVLEGEGCVDLARDQLGLNATTSAGGAKAPDRTEWRALAGRRVNVIPDAGKAGISYAHRVVEILLALDPPADPRIVELRGLEDGQDIEQFAEGKHPDQVRTEIERLAANVVVTAIADKTEPHDFPLTDTGNAERLIERHGRDLHHTRSHGWLHWIGTHWDRDITGAVERCAVETVRDMYARTANLELAKPRQTLAAFARSSESWKRLRDMIRIAQSQESVAITADALDCDRMLLNVGNGTVDLKTGTLREHRRDDLITRVCPVAYDPNAEAPLWLRFLGDVMGGDEDLIGFLRRAVGHSLTGDTSERCLFLLHGGGKNGKSTFLAACRAAMGDYALHARAETIMAKRGDSIPCDIARLKGARFVTFAETEEGKRLAVTTLKEMTGGTDPLTARFMRQDEFTFLPQFKPWLATNHKPVIRDQTDAIWDRIYTVPFTVRIAPDRVDKTLPKKLDAELPGILAWAVRGCLEWRREGLQPPDKVKAATREYRAEQDTFGRWRDECCTLGERCEANAGGLFKSYREWCEGGGERWITQNAFGRRLGDDGHEKRLGRQVVYFGIGLKSGSDGER